eukprot:scaffold735_cov255-Pinguiococcus_pyrenoidosus.AAC.3
MTPGIPSEYPSPPPETELNNTVGVQEVGGQGRRLVPLEGVALYCTYEGASQIFARHQGRHRAMPLRRPTCGSTKPCVARRITPVNAAIRRRTLPSAAFSPVNTSSSFRPRICAMESASSSAQRKD